VLLLPPSSKVLHATVNIYGARRHKLYDGLGAEHEARMKKPPTKAQVVAMWDKAGNDVLAEGVIEDSSVCGEKGCDGALVLATACSRRTAQ
jgi:hypothetical protein